MELRRAATHVFDDPRWSAKLGRAGLIACLPIAGDLFLAAYALPSIRAAMTDDPAVARGDWKVDLWTLMTGLKCQLLTVVCGLAAGLLTLPLWGLETAESTAEAADPAPALVVAFQGPTYLLATALMALLAGLCLARFALTGSAWAAVDVGAIWSHLRAEPATWIAVTVAGFAIAEAPVALVWLLPLSSSWHVPALLLATALFRPIGLLTQAHLIGQAYRWSAQTLARRRPLIVRVRW
jgi:hypothetical protein